MQPCAWAVHARRQNLTCLAFCRASSFSVFTRASWYSLKQAFFSPSDFKAEYLHTEELRQVHEQMHKLQQYTACSDDFHSVPCMAQRAQESARDLQVQCT